MLNYMKAEVYRTIKTKWYMNLLKVLCLFVVVESIYFLKNSGIIDCFDYTMMFFKFFALIIPITVTVVIYKRKDIKIELLSMGLSRKNIFIRDWISLQFITICSVFVLAILVLFEGVVAKLVFNEDSSVIIGFVLFTSKLFVYIININSGILGLSYLFNSVALGAVCSFVIIPSIFQVIMFLTDGKIYDIANQFLLIQPFKLMEIGLDSGSYLFSENLSLIIISFVFTLVVYLLIGYMKFKYSELS